MSSLTFKQFLSRVNEDLEQEISKLSADISMADTQIAQRTAPLVARKTQLQKMLAIKQKQAQAQANNTNSSSSTSNPSPQGSQVTTPGSSQSVR